MSSPRLLEGWDTNPVRSDQRSIRIPYAQELPHVSNETGGLHVNSRSAARRSSVMPKAMSSALKRVDCTKLTKRYSMDEATVSSTQKVTMFDDLRKKDPTKFIDIYAMTEKGGLWVGTNNIRNAILGAGRLASNRIN